MADKQLTKLIKATGSRQDFVAHYNAAIDESGDTITPHLRLRMLNYWTAESVPPAHVMIFILAAAMRAGLSAEQAIEIYPDLAPARQIARSVTQKSDGKTGGKAA